MSNNILLKNANILTVNSNKDIFFNTDILIEDSIISKIGKNIDTEEKKVKIIDLTKKIVLPGFIQTHIHLCQTLFRGMAEDRTLLNWLREKIWPLESFHDENSTFYSVMLGLGELICGGTTTILDMGGVYHCDKIFEAINLSNIRAFAGKAMMDTGNKAPASILESTQNSIDESLRLYNKWNNFDNGRINYALAPRFILSVSDNLFHSIKEISQEHNIPIHTHMYENKEEGKEILKLKGKRELDYFKDMGMLGSKFLAAHCIWTNKHDINILKETGTNVLHCPSSNLKLGSGALNLNTLIKENISVSVGADGASCNNNLDMLNEIRTTALLQSYLNEPGTIKAHKYIELATIEGAKALGIDKITGSIEENKKADLVIINLEDDFHCWNSNEVDIFTKIVYCAKSSNIETVIIDGKIVMENRNLKTIDKQNVLYNCNIEINKLLKRLNK